MQTDKNIVVSLQYLPQLDSLRALAIFLILFTHFFSVNEAHLLASSPLLGAILVKLYYFGLTGVTLFFILSGYLISKILIHSKSSTNYFSSFFMRRTLRIFPLFYLVLFFSFFIYPQFFSVPEEASKVIQEQWRLWTHLSNAQFIEPIGWDVDSYLNFGHFWTLNVEEHFYLIWPFLVYFIPTNKLGFYMSTILFLSIASWLLSHYISFFTWTTLTYSSSLSLGGLIAYYEYRDNNKLIQYAKWIQKYMYFYLLILFIAIFIPRNLGFFREISVYISTLILFSALLVTTLQNKIPLLNSKILIFIGKISYGIYVYHALLRPFFKEFFYEVPIKLYGVDNALLITTSYTLIASVLSILFAWISWELFEKQFLKLKVYFPYKYNESKV